MGLNHDGDDADHADHAGRPDDSILEPYRAALGPSLYAGYRNHAYRMLNFGQALAPPEPDRDVRLAVMAAFHDLPFCLDGNLDYLDRAADLTDAYWTSTIGAPGEKRSGS